MNTWTLRWSGVRTVVGLELRQRIRSRRWILALIAWFVVIGGTTALVITAVSEQQQNYSDGVTNSLAAGPIAFGLITFFVLGMALVIAPAFTATSINGDRTAGTLATLQATRLSAAEIAAGKLIAAWGAAAVFLVVALPFLAWAMVLGEISILQVLVCFVVVCLEVAVVSAIGLGWSALLGRAAGSTVLTYLTVVLLTVLGPILFGLATVVTIEEQPVRVWGLSQADMVAYQQQVDEYWSANPDSDGSGVPAPPISKCTWNTETQETTRTDRFWWLLVPNPFVIVSDAAPASEPGPKATWATTSTPLGALSYAVRYAALPPQTERDDCLQLYSWGPYNVETNPDGTVVVTTKSGVQVNVESPVKPRSANVTTPIWPWGLAVNLVLGAGFFWIAVRRLSVPYGALPRGTRVA